MTFKGRCKALSGPALASSVVPPSLSLWSTPGNSYSLSLALSQFASSRSPDGGIMVAFGRPLGHLRARVRTAMMKPEDITYLEGRRIVIELASKFSGLMNGSWGFAADHRTTSGGRCCRLTERVAVPC
jgi:hypothetical protein